MSDSIPTDAVDTVLAASRALMAVSARSIASSGVTLPQFRMLVVLSASPTNLTGLAEALDVAPSTALRMVDRLVSAGLVKREVRSDNRRETALSLTPGGRRTVSSVLDRRRRDLEAVLERVPAAQRRELGRAMTALAVATEELWPGITTAVS